MSAKITLAAFAVVLAAVSVSGTVFAKSKVPSDARASQATSPGRADYRALGGAYGAAPDNFSQGRVYAPNRYQPCSKRSGFWSIAAA